MAFVVEDGTGVSNANSYALVADADAYWADRGNTAWAALSNSNKQIALVKATDYIDNRFGGRMIGTKATETQALEFPRIDTGNDVWDYDTIEEEGVIPIALQRATFEYADRARVAELAPDPVMDDAGVSMVTVKEEIGPIKTESQPVGGYSATVNVLRPYPAADMYMRTLVVASAGVIHA